MRNLRSWIKTVLWLSVIAHPRFGLTDDFRGVEKAAIEVANGVPRLSINGKPVLPIIFFFNKDIGGSESDRFQDLQVRLLARAGVHIYALPFRGFRAADGVTPTFGATDRILDSFIKTDPQAVFILRVYPGPHSFWKEWKSLPAGHIATFADGTQGFISIASDYFWGPSNEDRPCLIHHYESGPYGKRILGYHLGGPEHEMFMDRYRESGPDYSEVNVKGFRVWLKSRYKNDESLRRASGAREIALETAAVPREPGRFPMHLNPGGKVLQVFYRLPQEQDWVDYSAYCSDIARGSHRQLGQARQEDHAAQTADPLLLRVRFRASRQPERPLRPRSRLEVPRSRHRV